MRFQVLNWNFGCLSISGYFLSCGGASSMESSFAALVLDDEDGDDLDLKTVAVEVQPDTNQLVVVGCVLTDKIVNFGTTRNTLSNLLRSGNGLYIQDLGRNMFLP